MKICVQGVLLSSMAMKTKRESRIGQGVKLSRDAVSIEVTAKPTRNSEDKVALSCPELG